MSKEQQKLPNGWKVMPSVGEAVYRNESPPLIGYESIVHEYDGYSNYNIFHRMQDGDYYAR